MKNKGNIGTTFVVIILSAFIFVFGGAGFTKREPNTYYAVYVDGKKIGDVDPKEVTEPEPGKPTDKSLAPERIPDAGKGI